MTRRLAALGAVLVLLILVGLALHEPRAEGITGWRAELFVAVLAAAGAAYLLSVLFLLRGGRPSRATLWIVLGVAIAMRLPPLLAPPFLSSDLNRYIWDGRVQQAGINPYVYVPADPALASLRDDMIYPHVYRADYAPTIYPPMAQVIFAAIAGIAETRFAVKLTMLASRAGEFRPHALPKPYVTLSDHTASDVQPLTCSTRQCANRVGFARCIRANQSRARFGRGRRRLNLLRAQRIRWASMQRSVQHSADP